MKQAQGAAGEAVLPARPEGQGGPHEGEARGAGVDAAGRPGRIDDLSGGGRMATPDPERRARRQEAARPQRRRAPLHVRGSRSRRARRASPWSRAWTRSAGARCAARWWPARWCWGTTSTRRASTTRKRLTARQREQLSARVREKAAAFCVGVADPREIDRLNILRATHLAMQRAVAGPAPRARRHPGRRPHRARRGHARSGRSSRATRSRSRSRPPPSWPRSSGTR